MLNSIPLTLVFYFYFIFIGKFIVCYVPACGEKEYYLACACEELYAPPSAYFSLYGLTVQSSFLGGMFSPKVLHMFLHKIDCIRQLEVEDI